MTSSLYGASAEYGLHSLLILSARKEPVAVRDLARFQKLPERFLAKLFTRLKKAGIVEGIEGSRGGFVLARAPEQVSVMDILRAIDPDRTLFECAEIRRDCELFEGEPPIWSVAGPCRIHLFMQEAETVLHAYLSSKTLADLGREFESKAPKKFLSNSEQWFQSRLSQRRGEGEGAAHAKCAGGKTCDSRNSCNISRKTKSNE